MNENINLCEILKGLEDIELYSTVHGKVILDKIDINCTYPIKFTTFSSNIIMSVSSKGIYDDRYDGECILFPSKDQRDWSKFEKPIPVDTPMVVCYSLEEYYSLNFKIRFYKDKFNVNGRHYCYDDGYKSNSLIGLSSDWNIMIPFDKFNPNNIEESLKYNIQK